MQWLWSAKAQPINLTDVEPLEFSALHERLGLGQKGPVIGDVDTGVDDATAITVLGATPTVELIGMVASGGNVAVEYTTENTIQVLEAMGHGDVTVHRGAAHPSHWKPGMVVADAAGAHGTSGLGPKANLPPPQHKPSTIPGDTFMASQIREKDRLTLFCTGGLTDLYRVMSWLEPKPPGIGQRMLEWLGGTPVGKALCDHGMLQLVCEEEVRARRNNALDHLQAVYIMGGVFDPKEANAPVGENRYGEFNALHDPAATAAVYAAAERHNIPLIVAPLDLTHGLPFGEEEAKKLRALGNPVADLVAGFIEEPGPWDVERYGRKAVPLHDASVALAHARPDLFQVRQVKVAVQGPEDPQPGAMRVSGAKGGNVYVLSVPPERREAVKDALIEILGRYPLPDKGVLSLAGQEAQAHDAQLGDDGFERAA